MLKKIIELFVFAALFSIFSAGCTSGSGSAALPNDRVAKPTASQTSVDTKSTPQGGNTDVSKENKDQESVQNSGSSTNPAIAQDKNQDFGGGFKTAFIDSAGLAWSQSVGMYALTTTVKSTDAEGNSSIEEIAKALAAYDWILDRTVYFPDSPAAKACEDIGGRLPTPTELFRMVVETKKAYSQFSSPAQAFQDSFKLPVKGYVWSSDFKIEKGTLGYAFPYTLILSFLNTYLSSGREGFSTVRDSEWGISDRSDEEQLDVKDNAYTICVKYSDSLRNVTSTPERHVSITGAVFVRDYSIPKFGVAYRDPSGKIWSDGFTDQHCKISGTHIPNETEINELRNYLGRSSPGGFQWSTSDGKFPMLSGFLQDHILTDDRNQYFAVCASDVVVKK